MASMEIWLEYASTYSYLTVMRVGALADAHGVQLAFVVGQELFWGDDRLEDAIACAAGAR